jgi:hypothetical protein
MASLDGINKEHSELIEIKVVGVKSFNSFKNKGIPLYYFQQMQWQMYCSGLSKGYFVYYCHVDGKINLIEVSSNDDYLCEIVSEAIPFAEKLIKIKQELNT